MTKEAKVTLAIWVLVVVLGLIGGLLGKVTK